ncbi:hypothetical protein [Limobrevibacterium gyesilva]|uniref:Lipoprotein SmpA/OmlA domain-containing protein n=1 Tax=Limobrevibacterium gyesilva TaxID=2991712 RepID=A0AA41YSI6_9PROT|nr:hypothetical protein [Limobrevibacterium gyesilva]MCW3477757.1 hypothetical protein [Limobrevibacterium gyesilva]
MMARWALALVLPMTLLAACAPKVGAPEGAPAPVAAEPARPRPVPPEHVAALIGVGPEAVEAALGAPVLRRAEGTAEVWLYATAEGCRLDVVLFPEKSGLRVAHASTRTPVRMTETSCLRAIADRPA